MAMKEDPYVLCYGIGAAYLLLFLASRYLDEARSSQPFFLDWLDRWISLSGLSTVAYGMVTNTIGLELIPIALICGVAGGLVIFLHEKWIRRKAMSKAEPAQEYA